MEGQLSQEATTRAGYVALVGLPNAGKSTLLNALAGEHLSIVTAKAQTTWQRVAAIRTEEAVQMILLDTPGIVTTRQLFHRSMLAEAMGTLREADVAVAVVDGAARNPSPELGALFESLKTAGCPAAVAVNKADHPRFDPRPARMLAESAGLPWYPVSALAGGGLDALLALVRTNLPESPFLYPEDEIAAAPTRFFVQELIRETVFEQYHQEIPYSVAVRVEESRVRGGNPVRRAKVPEGDPGRKGRDRDPGPGGCLAPQDRASSGRAGVPGSLGEGLGRLAAKEGGTDDIRLPGA